MCILQNLPRSCRWVCYIQFAGALPLHWCIPDLSVINFQIVLSSTYVANCLSFVRNHCLKTIIAGTPSVRDGCSAFSLKVGFSLENWVGSLITYTCVHGLIFVDVGNIYIFASVFTIFIDREGTAATHSWHCEYWSRSLVRMKTDFLRKLKVLKYLSKKESSTGFISLHLNDRRHVWKSALLLD